MPYRNFINLILALLLVFSGCNEGDDELANFELVYSNDFETVPDSSIIGGSLHSFNGSQMQGNFNNDGFFLTIENLPDHQQIMMTFDLYIHDSWDGNDEGEAGPDVWGFEIGDIIPNGDHSQGVFLTTFSNSLCELVRCPYQSFPGTYPSQKSPRSGMADIPLPGMCQLIDVERGTNLYRMEKAFNHANKTLIVRFFDELVQLNALRANCDESWSLDNLNVYIFNLE